MSWTLMNSGSRDLLGCSSAWMLPWKQDVADGRPVTVDTQKAESQGDLGHPGASSLDEQVDEEQAESSQQGEDGPVFRTAGGRKRHLTNHQQKLWLIAKKKYLSRNQNKVSYILQQQIKVLEATALWLFVKNFNTLCNEEKIGPQRTTQQSWGDICVFQAVLGWGFTHSWVIGKASSHYPSSSRWR